MPRFRFTIRRMMVAVAIVAIPMGILVERQRRFSRIAASLETGGSRPSILLGVVGSVAVRD